jgi:hypothetical protein
LFKTLRQNFRIEKAHQICETELGLSARKIMKMMPPEATREIQAMMREAQDRGAGEHDIAVLLVTPHLWALDSDARRLIAAQVYAWSETGRIALGTYEHFLETVNETQSSAGPGENVSSHEPTLSAQHWRAVEVATGVLSTQAVLGAPTQGDFLLPFSLGYVFGVVDGVLQRTALDGDADAMTAISAVFGKLVGHRPNEGPEAYGRALRLHLDEDADFLRGQILGGRELFDLAAGRSTAMTGWARYLHERRGRV